MYIVHIRIEPVGKLDVKFRISQDQVCKLCLGKMGASLVHDDKDYTSDTQGGHNLK